MQLKLLSLPVPAAGDTLDPDALSEAVGGAKIKAFSAHVVRDLHGARLVVVVGVDARRSPPDVTQDLDAGQRALFEGLRVWRARMAATLGTAPYLILPNRSLAELAKAPPSDLAALGQVHGVGPAKLVAFGDALLEQLAQLRGDPGAATVAQSEAATAR